MDSIQTLLDGRIPTEPPEIKIIKEYVAQEFGEIVDVMVRERDIIIIVHSSALANTLRLRTPEVKKLCDTDKKLTFRII